MTLSKSDYMLFLRHPAWLWLKKHDKSKLPPIDENLQAVFDAGHEFEKYAEKLYPDAVKIGFNENDFGIYKSMPFRTKKALDEDAKTILQGRLETDGLNCIFDVLERNHDGTYNLYEIKSSNKAKPEHEYDLAFQVVVLESTGLSIKNIAVMHVNKEYIRSGSIDPEKLVIKTDITEKVRALSDITTKQINSAQDILTKKDMPDLSHRYVNILDIPRVTWFQDWMKIYKVLNPDLDPFSIYHLSYPNAEQIGQLEDKGITMINDIPEEMALRPRQVTQIQTTKNNKRIIDKEQIKEFLDTFEYPLYFFDYETLSSVIPAFDGFSPYGDYPFQYSLHVLDNPDAEVRHTEYLHQENSNPLPSLIEQMKKDIGDKGTILAWHMSYEKGCNKRMAKLYPEDAEFLEDINSRMNDLKLPFSNMWFVDKDFYGSASIKDVMPVLAPDLSYKELTIADGLLARRLWTKTILEGKNQDKRQEILSDLSKYCTLDTYAMVRILEELIAL